MAVTKLTWWGDSLALALNYSIFVYLLAYGTAHLVFMVLQVTVDHYPASTLGIGDWLFAPIHIVPAAAALAYRSDAYRWLAKRKLRASADSHELEAQRVPASAGSMAQVKEVIATGSGALDDYINCGRDNGEQYTLLHLACWNGHTNAVKALLDANADVDKGTMLQQQSALMLAARRGHDACVSRLLEHEPRADIYHRAADSTTALTVALATGEVMVLQLLLANGAGEVGEQEQAHQKWMGLRNSDIAVAARGRKDSAAVTKVLRAHESEFTGNILEERGCACVASWPGVYAKLWDKLVAQGRADKLSAAVVFLPEHTLHFGQHSDRCCCVEMYGEVRNVKPWGCKWFALWRQHIDEAVARGQRLQVYYLENRVGEGKNDSWGTCKDEAIMRDTFWRRKQAFLAALSRAEQEQLKELSSEQRDDSRGETPGSERGDEEDCLFMASLSEGDRQFLEEQKGLGNSQKAEVAWLDKCGYGYEELDVRDFGKQR
eukprot:g1373.t1